MNNSENHVNKKLSKYGFVLLIMILLSEMRTYLTSYIDYTLITVIWGGICLLLFLYMALLSIKLNRPVFQFKNASLISLFIGIYSFRVIYDVAIKNIFSTNVKNGETFLFLILCGCIIPFVSILFLNIKEEKYHLLAKIIYTVILFFVSFSILMNIQKIFSGDIIYQGRFKANEYLDMILFGHMGVSLILLSIYFMWIDANVYHKYLYVLSILLGIIVMMMANSRGPIVTCFFILLLLIYLKRMYLILLGIVVAFAIFYFNISEIDYFFRENLNSNFVSRIASIIQFGDLAIYDDDTASDRNIAIHGLKMFLDSPILGESFLINTGIDRGSYAHNLFVSAFMSVGIFGGLLFVYINIYTLYCSIYILKKDANKSFLSLLFLQYFMLLMFSKDIYFEPHYWCLLGLVCLNYDIMRKSYCV